MRFKHTIPVGALLMILLLAAFSCKKSFLEIDPKGKLIARDVSDYDLLLNNSTFMSTGGANAQVYLGDEVAAAEPYFSAAEPRSQRLFRWEAAVYEMEQDAPETQSLLRQLYAYNKIISEVGDASGGTEQQKNSIRAEAMAGRAWVNFMLVNYFGKPFHPETAASDPGFPIILAADVTAQTFTRASVREVYDLIEEDLLAAISDLPARTTHRLRMSKGAGQALLGKVYMFMGRFEEALPLLTNAIENMQTAEVDVHLIDYNTAFASGGLFQPISIFGPTTPVLAEDPETIYARQFSNFWITSSELLMAPEAAALFGASDLRLNFYSRMPFPAGPEFPSGLLRRMGPLTTSYGVVLPDLILLRAECRARLNDLTGCVQDLETLRAYRMPLADAAVPNTVSGERLPLLNFVLEERIREFACQGVRWLDMRRLSVDPLFGFSGYKHRVYEEDGTMREFTLTRERLVMKLPPKILGENPGMIDNP